MTEYAKVVDGVVVNVIVADALHIATRADGPWILTPYNGSTGKVGMGCTYDGANFAAPADLLP